MKNILTVSILVLSFAFVVSSQTNQDLSCPIISVSGGGFTEPGGPMTFTANVGGYDLSKLSFSWTVSKGEILKGQGTPTISVNTEKWEDTTRTATVEIGGLPEGCANTGSETGSIIIERRTTQIDEYGKILFTKEKTRLDTIGAQLSEDVNSGIYFIIYVTNKQKPTEIKTRQANIEKYLMENYKISKDRIFFMLRESDIYQTKIFIVPPGAENPTP